MTTPEQDILPTVAVPLETIPEVDDEDETLSVESAETEEDSNDWQDELYEQWLSEQGCEYCSGCQYCEESSAFDGGTDI